MRATALVGPALASRRGRLVGLLAFAGLFLAAGLAARLLAADEHGHPDLDRVFAIGGYPLVSGLLLLGWLLGRYPMIAVLVLLAGFFSHDRAAGHARMVYVRPVSPLSVYGARFVALAALAFVSSAVLMPVFDYIMLGTWAGPATFVLILSYVLVYGGLTALFSVWSRADAWIALGLGLLAMVWNALREAGALGLPPGLRDFIGFVLPPQHALLRLEEAFAGVQPIPWDAFAYVAAYGVAALLLAGLALHQREV